MTYDEAHSAAILGARVRHADMQPGSYIDYNFKGLYIHFPSGSSSGWYPRDFDLSADWETYDPQPLNVGKLTVDGDVTIYFNAELSKRILDKWRKPVARDKWGRPC